MNLQGATFDVDGVIETLGKHEGRKNEKYQDPKGIWTIGVGFNIDIPMPSRVVHAMVEDGLTDAQIDRMLIVHIEEHWEDLVRAQPVVAELPAPAQEALLDMAFQIGVPGLVNFRKMWEGINEGDWIKAVAEAKDSKWFREDTQEDRLDYVINRLESMQ